MMPDNGSSPEPSKKTNLPDLLRAQAARRPDEPAVVYGEDRLSYRELLRRSDRVAGCLHRLGVRADARVGLFMEPSLDLMTGAWGILCAGGAYLPLSPEYPEERLRYMIEDSATDVILTQPDLLERLTALAPEGTSIVTLDDTEGHGPAPVRPAAENLAYVIYTSGSTGRPKGVMIEHRSVVNQLLWLAEEHGIGPGTRVLQKTPMSFDAAQWEILAPACGALVVMGSPGIHRDAERIIRTVQDHGVTTLQCVPTLLQALLDTCELGECASLRQIFTGGEALTRTLAQECLDAVPQATLVNLYGPTECTINSSAFPVDRAAVGDGPNSVSIGAPVAGTTYRILDEKQKEVAVGEVGELYIGGVQLARGYLHRPELTEERFVPDPFGPGRLFRTGDLAYWNADGTVQFVGRADNQVKLRGFRVELDEIKLAIETHTWVKHAAVIVKKDPRTGFQNLIACVELNPREAALMDQGNHGAHHQSKESKLQVKAQLSNPGVRNAAEIAGRPVTDLPGREATEAQRRQAFARKTYRFYEGGEVSREDVLRLLGRRVTGGRRRTPAEVGREEFGEILRWFGQHLSEERLLPKYGYASPGSLYATQLYLELAGIADLPAGLYYYHPVEHRLVLIGETAGRPGPRAVLHFLGRKRAIEPVYKNNIREVLEIETGHMVGLLEEVLPGYGLDIAPLEYTPQVKDRLDVAEEDYYLGTFALVPYDGPREDPPVDLYVQAHPGKVAGLPAGQYAYQDGRLERISSEMVLRREVIAINQAVYDRASLGISVISRGGPDWRRYIDLGRTLQHLSMNDTGLGFMSSGYSSRGGDDLPSARMMDAVLGALGRPTGPSYFFVGGKVSEEQRRHEGMNEDVVHMRGPAEMIRDDLINFLPDYMIPNKVVVLDELPVTANGKIDVRALAASDQTDVGSDERPFTAPRTTAERRIAQLWRKAMKREQVSVHEDFFASGGNSLIAVGLINKINRELGASLPLQVLFESPTIEALARRVQVGDEAEASRLVPLRREGTGRPMFCWPGLGGYTMNLRLLAERMGKGRPFYGVQAYGINAGEEPYPTIRQMAEHDVRAIRETQPQGPYTLLGYSFGARVAFETAYQLEQLGETVEHVVLIAPGAPKVRSACAMERNASYENKAYVRILFSVFSGTLDGPLADECVAVARDDRTFAEFVSAHFPGLDIDLVLRIIQVVGTTFEFSYTFRELTERRISAPITVFKARGDDYSFLDGADGYADTPPVMVDLDADHYSILKDPDVGELAKAVRRRLGLQKETIMPHVNIKHFPVALSREQQLRLVTAVTEAVSTAFGCDEGVVSIAIEPVDKERWNEQVYIPEIVNRRHILTKAPDYGLDAS
ncbi:amino acid adenylation domain-containing protein [Streptomyces sp. XM83C]|uniref:amino acid adenylation domain-containing protein n=1 Tax=Streptomyces sp. XM83C TaxID=2929781 RepID=UPI001FFB223F|nr:amino acid adenylation domain-containing protein [Streptomyces sp. XM83C]MCK1818520.1 amino acid adenylation domain-containing protein [Streptomyces sp. XM83C]